MPEYFILHNWVAFLNRNLWDSVSFYLFFFVSKQKLGRIGISIPSKWEKQNLHNYIYKNRMLSLNTPKWGWTSSFLSHPSPSKSISNIKKDSKISFIPRFPNPKDNYVKLDCQRRIFVSSAFVHKSSYKDSILTFRWNYPREIGFKQLLSDIWTATICLLALTSWR